MAEFFFFRTPVLLLVKMPIASGAAGRVDIGVDTNKRWTPDGLKRNTQPVFRQYDSYLLRHLELKQMQKKENTLKCKTDQSPHKNDGPEEELPQKNGCLDDNLGPPSSGETSKTSKLCVVL